MCVCKWVWVRACMHSKGGGLSSGWPLKRGSTVYTYMSCFSQIHPVDHVSQYFITYSSNQDTYCIGNNRFSGVLSNF